MNRRSALQSLAAAALAPLAVSAANTRFKISLAEWSIHKAIQKRTLTNLDFPKVAHDFGIEGLEFVNQLWGAPTQSYLASLKKRMTDNGCKGVLIMCDDEGAMGHSNKAARMKAVDNHIKWLDSAAELGCHSIRVNMYPDKEPKTPAEIDAFIGYCAESFTKLCGLAKDRGLNVIIENHGGVSSEADVLVKLMKAVNLPNFGLLPDFGNFYGKQDRFESVRKMLPYAKGVSFKCFDFGPNGKETRFDMDKMMKIVIDSKYSGYVGIEYEGDRTPEMEGIAAGKKYLDKLFATL
ncbi:MAG: sugar phosphate isomerase/epimerase family protein [Bryobacteraceae bacterium]